jgi:hypothetical protein
MFALLITLVSSISANNVVQETSGKLTRRAPFKISYNRHIDKNSALFGSSMSAQTTLLTTMIIGNPPQELDILLDTGSSLFWVIKAKGCQGVIDGENGECPGENKYDNSKSSSFRSIDYTRSTSYAYGSGANPNTALRCTVFGYDYISIGKNSKGNVEYLNHPICEATYIKLANSYELDLPYDGIMGLAPRPDDKNAIVYVGNTFLPQYGAVSFWYNRALLHNLNDDGQFGFKPTNQDIGFVTFGKDVHPDLQKDLIIS